MRQRTALRKAGCTQAQVSAAQRVNVNSSSVAHQLAIDVAVDYAATPLYFQQKAGGFPKSDEVKQSELAGSIADRTARYQLTGRYTHATTRFMPQLMNFLISRKMQQTHVKLAYIRVKHLIKNIYWGLRIYLNVDPFDGRFFLRDREPTLCTDVTDQFQAQALAESAEHSYRSGLRYRFQPVRVVRVKNKRRFRADWIRRFLSKGYALYQEDESRYGFFLLRTERIRCLFVGARGIVSYHTAKTYTTVESRARALLHLKYSRSTPRFEMMLRSTRRDPRREVFPVVGFGVVDSNNFFTRQFSTSAASKAFSRLVQHRRRFAALLENNTATPYKSVTSRYRAANRTEARDKTSFLSARTKSFASSRLDGRFVRTKSPRNRQYLVRAPSNSLPAFIRAYKLGVYRTTKERLTSFPTTTTWERRGRRSTLSSTIPQLRKVSRPNVLIARRQPSPRLAAKTDYVRSRIIPRRSFTSNRTSIRFQRTLRVTPQHRLQWRRREQQNAVARRTYAYKKWVIANQRHNKLKETIKDHFEYAAAKKELPALGARVARGILKLDKEYFDKLKDQYPNHDNFWTQFAPAKQWVGSVSEKRKFYVPLLLEVNRFLRLSAVAPHSYPAPYFQQQKRLVDASKKKTDALRKVYWDWSARACRLLRSMNASQIKNLRKAATLSQRFRWNAITGHLGWLSFRSEKFGDKEVSLDADIPEPPSFAIREHFRNNTAKQRSLAKRCARILRRRRLTRFDTYRTRLWDKLTLRWNKRRRRIKRWTRRTGDWLKDPWLAEAVHVEERRPRLRGELPAIPRHVGEYVPEVDEFGKDIPELLAPRERHAPLVSQKPRKQRKHLRLKKYSPGLAGLFERQRLRISELLRRKPVPTMWLANYEYNEFMKEDSAERKKSWAEKVEERRLADKAERVRIRKGLPKERPLREAFKQPALHWLPRREWREIARRARKLVWKESDGVFFRRGFRSAFRFHYKEAKRAPWLEALMYNRATFSTRLGEFRRRSFPREQKKYKWLQRVRKQLYAPRHRARYTKRRRWAQLRTYNQRLHCSLFSLPNQRSARRHFKRLNRRTRPAISSFVSSSQGLTNRLDVTLVLMKIVPSIFWARVVAPLGLLQVNGKIQKDPAFRLVTNDVIRPLWDRIARFQHFFKAPLRYREKHQQRNRKSPKSYPGNMEYHAGTRMIIYRHAPKSTHLKRSDRVRPSMFRWFKLDSE
jgi:ribosomal protein S4